MTRRTYDRVIVHYHLEYPDGEIKRKRTTLQWGPRIQTVQTSIEGWTLAVTRHDHKGETYHYSCSLYTRQMKLLAAIMQVGMRLHLDTFYPWWPYEGQPRLAMVQTKMLTPAPLTKAKK